MLEYEESIEAFAQMLQNFMDQYELPAKWFKVPDHLAIKCADALDYEYVIQDLLPDAQQTSVANIDNRRLVAMHLITTQPVGQLGSVSWLEIMEPRPEKAGKDRVGLEHMEFYYPDFDEVRGVLDEYQVEYTEQSNAGHAWINIVINADGQELKLNNRLLSDIVEQELSEGTARLIS